MHTCMYAHIHAPTYTRACLHAPTYTRARTKLINYIERGDTMADVTVGELWDSGKVELRIDSMQWPGNSTTVPADREGHIPCLD